MQEKHIFGNDDFAIRKQRKAHLRETLSKVPLAKLLTKNQKVKTVRVSGGFVFRTEAGRRIALAIRSPFFNQNGQYEVSWDSAFCRVGGDSSFTDAFEQKVHHDTKGVPDWPSLNWLFNECFETENEPGENVLDMYEELFGEPLVL